MALIIATPRFTDWVVVLQSHPPSGAAGPETTLSQVASV